MIRIYQSNNDLSIQFRDYKDIAFNILEDAIYTTKYNFEIENFGDHWLVELGEIPIMSIFEYEDETFENFVNLNKEFINYNLNLQYDNIFKGDVFKGFECVTNIQYFSKDGSIWFHLIFSPESTFKNWNFDWSPKKCLEIIKNNKDLFHELDDVQVEIEEENYYIMAVKYFDGKDSIQKSINQTIIEVLKIEEFVLRALNPFRWKVEYETNEQLFTVDILIPMLRKLNFQNVKYNHGTKEYGKDILLKEIDKFGNNRLLAVQVKAGNVSGKVNSAIDELIGQLDDSFSMPFIDHNNNETYISSLYIIISGKFTSNAIDKIRRKMSSKFRGNVFFMDKENILDISQKIWRN